MPRTRNHTRAPKAPPQLPTLSSFFEDNVRLVSAFGILIAVSTFSGNLALRPFGIALSFLFLVAAILVWLELWRNFPAGRVHWVLFLFRIIISLITLVMILYWLVFFRSYLHPILVVGLMLLCLGALAQGLKHLGVVDGLFLSRIAEPRLPRLLASAALAGIAVAFSTALAVVVSGIVAPRLTLLLESLYRSLQLASA